MAAARIGNRRVFIKDGTWTQTVNICDASNRHGNYETVYRITGRECFVRPADVTHCRTLDQLSNLLVTQHHASLEPGRVTVPVVGVTAATAIRADAASCVQPTPLACSLNDPWLSEARQAVERAIDRLVTEFLDFPYLHRVEHSLHTRLVALMAEEEALAGNFPVGTGLAVTQLIHKEWPETLPRPEKRNRRGNFDLAVLAPQQLAQCPSVADFLTGRLAAPIAVEVGLDYDYAHLAADRDKVLNSRVPFGYLVHLSREWPPDPRAEQLVQAPSGDVRAAYGLIVGGRRFCKLVNQPAVIEVPAPARNGTAG
jgi:hypothetical protein